MMKFTVPFVFLLLVPLGAEAALSRCARGLGKTKIVFGQAEAGITYQERPGASALLQNAAGEIAVVETPNGHFLPGGGVDPGESFAQALQRELLEEIGFRMVSSQKVGRASQFLWSPFYGQHFHKDGTFFRIQAIYVDASHLEPDHKLVWWAPAKAATELSHEFQRWAIENLLPP